MNRRDLITLLGGAAAWPVTARAQQVDRVRRLGILWASAENDSARKIWVAAFMVGLAELGWTEGRNLRLDVRWDPRTPEQTQKFVEELVALRPDVLVTGTARLTLALQQQTRTIPIVFVGAGDPLARGLIADLSHPGGNTTGVTDLFPSIAGKWLELLKECAPSLTRVGLIFNPDIAIQSDGGASGPRLFAAQAGSQYGVKTIEIPVRNTGDIERAISAFAVEPGGGLIVVPPPLSDTERKLVNGLAIRYQLPVIYQDKSFVVEGGLLSYGADMMDMHRYGAPPYVDRILRGAKPGDLPVQFPTKFTLAVNITTAKAMGLTIPESFLLRADELIE